MTDSKKVLNDLQELCEYLFHKYNVCYKGDEEDTYNRFLAANNALELLKEQEPVHVQKREFAHMWFWCCGSCGVAITEGDKFCRMCGKAVKWK